MKKLNNKGFTLIELLAVLVILIAIMSIAMPTFSSSLRSSKESQNKKKIEYLERVAEIYIADHKKEIGRNECIELSTLLDENYVNSDALLYSNGEEISGCISYNSTNNTYEYKKDGEFVNSKKKLDLGYYVSYVPSKDSAVADKSKTGYSKNQTFNPKELNLWRIIKLNDNGTVDAVSQYASRASIYFSGTIGYQNYIGYLNNLAEQYINDKYAVGARNIGYSTQTKVLPADFYNYVMDATSEDTGGGDSRYDLDYNLVSDLGILKTYNAGTTNNASYWISSRWYEYNDFEDVWNVRFFNSGFGSDGTLTMSGLYYCELIPPDDGDEDDIDVSEEENEVENENTSENEVENENNGEKDTNVEWTSVCSDNGFSNSLRPIITLKSGLTCEGEGTLESPCVLN